jgi:hypothetical protein
MKLVKGLLVAGAVLTANGVSADMMGDINPILGVDYYQAWMKGKNSFANFFPKSYPGATVYVGAKFHENFGVELGYDVSGRQKHNWTLAQGSTFFGTTNTNATYTGTTKVRRSGGHIDLVGYLPVMECVDLTASVGYGWLKTKIDSTFSLANPAASGSASTIASFKGKNKGVFRLGVGANFMVTDMVGFRGKVSWENTSALRVNSTPTAALTGLIPNKAFKDTIALAVGAFVKF